MPASWQLELSRNFADALEQCIRNAAAEAAASLPQWGDACMPPTQKIDLQAKVLDSTLASIHEAYGYTGALWCAFYSVRMTGAEYDPNDSQPNNPNIFDWYDTLLCPWDVDAEVIAKNGGTGTPCGDEELGGGGAAGRSGLAPNLISRTHRTGSRQSDLDGLYQRQTPVHP